MEKGDKKNRHRHVTARIFWGLVFLLGAAALAFNQFGVIGVEKLNFWTIIISLLLLSICIGSLINRFWFGIVLPLVFGALLYRDMIGLPDEVTWKGTICVGVLLSIGLTILFHRRNYGNKWSKVVYVDDDGRSIDEKEHFEEVINRPDGSEIYANTHFGSTVKYINSSSMKKVKLDCSFGAMKVYFDNAVPDPEGAEIYIDISFGAIEMFVPKNWRLTDNLGRRFSGVEEKNQCRLNDDSPHVSVIGDLSFSGLTIIYV